MMEALHWDGDGFVLLYKRLGNVKFGRIKNEYKINQKRDLIPGKIIRLHAITSR